MHQLKRDEFRPDGIFGNFTFEGDSNPFMRTLEHSYETQDTKTGECTYAPIITTGVHTCIRGTHALENGVPFETFEITGVPGHSGLLFHPGNFNKDSRGCVLCGTDEVNDGTEEMITASKVRFAAFMARLKGVDSFQLEVI